MRRLYAGGGGFTHLQANTVNDKSFEGEKFRGLLGMRGKVLQFFPSPPSYIHEYIHGFKKQLREFQRKFRVPHLKTVISILGNGREYITDTCVKISHFPGWIS